MPKKRQKTFRHKVITKPRQKVHKSKLKAFFTRKKQNTRSRISQPIFFGDFYSSSSSSSSSIPQPPPNIFNQILFEMGIGDIERNEEQLIYIEDKYKQLYHREKRLGSYFNYDNELCCSDEDRENIFKITTLIHQMEEYQRLDIVAIYAVLVHIFYALRYNEQSFVWLTNRFLTDNLNVQYSKEIVHLAMQLYFYITVGDLYLGHHNLSSHIRRIVMEMDDY